MQFLRRYIQRFDQRMMAKLRGLGRIFTLDEFGEQRATGDQPATAVSLEPGGDDASAFVDAQTQLQQIAANRLADLHGGHRRIAWVEITGVAGMFKMSPRCRAQFQHDRGSDHRRRVLLIGPRGVGSGGFMPAVGAGGGMQFTTPQFAELQFARINPGLPQDLA